MTQGINQVAMAWFILDFTGNSIAWVGIITFAFGLPVFLFTLPAGILADKWDRKNQLIMAEAFGVIAALIFAGLFLFGIVSTNIALVFSFLFGTSIAFGHPARQALVPTLVPRDMLLNAIALSSMAQNTSRLIGPAVAGFLVAFTGFSVTFFMMAGMLSAGVLCLLFMRRDLFVINKVASDPQGELKAPNNRVHELFEGVRFLIGYRPLLVLAGLFFLSGLLVAGPSQALIPVIIKTELGKDAYHLGLLFTAQSVGMILMALYLTTQGSLSNKGGWFATSMVVAMFFYAGYIYSPWYSTTMIFFFLYGLAAGIYINMSQTLMTAHTPHHLLGRVLSIYALSLQGFLPLGALLAGLLATEIGAQPAALSGAILALIAASIALIFAKSFRRLG